MFHVGAQVWGHGDLTSLTHLPLRNWIYSQSVKTRQAYACFNKREWPKWCSVTSKARSKRSCDPAWITVRSLIGEAICRSGAWSQQRLALKPSLPRCRQVKDASKCHLDPWDQPIHLLNSQVTTIDAIWNRWITQLNPAWVLALKSERSDKMVSGHHIAGSQVTQQWITTKDIFGNR